MLTVECSSLEDSLNGVALTYLHEVGLEERLCAAERTAELTRPLQPDPEIGELWLVFQDQYMADQRVVAERLAAKGVLRKELEAAEAAEIIGMLNHPSVYYLAVFERGWPEERFERWLADSLLRQLLA